MKVRRVKIRKQLLVNCTNARVYWKLKREAANVRTGDGEIYSRYMKFKSHIRFQIVYLVEK